MLVSIGYWFLIVALAVLFLLIIANVIYSRAEKRNNKGIYKSTKKLMEKDGKLNDRKTYWCRT